MGYEGEEGYNERPSYPDPREVLVRGRRRLVNGRGALAIQPAVSLGSRRRGDDGWPGVRGHWRTLWTLWAFSLAHGKWCTVG